MAENYFGLSDVGRKRDNNEDAFLAEKLPTGWILACVIDGVGGYEGGEVAADIARATIRKKLESASGDAVQILREALLEANANIYKEKMAGHGSSQMACVLTAALVDPANNQTFYAHVGDTRMYLLRDGSLVKVTKDHSFVGFLEDSGRLSEAEAMSHPKRNEINKALGFDTQIALTDDYIETGSSPFLPGDLLVLCSDGLTDLVNAKDITAILLAQTSLAAKAQTLIDAANNAGGKDNITVVLVQNDKKPQKQRATKPVTLKKKEPVGEAPLTVVNTPEKSVQLPPKKRSNTVLFVFIFLTLLFATASWWMWNEKKKAEALLPLPATPVVLSPEAKRLRDSLGLAAHSFSYVDTAQTRTLVLNDTLFIRQDTLRFNGNGLVLQADSAFGGPALFATANCKQLVLENMVFRGFKIGMIAQAKSWQLKNVRFESCNLPVLEEAALRQHTDSVKQSFKDSTHLRNGRTHR